jgi:ribosome-associated protein
VPARRLAIRPGLSVPLDEITLRTSRSSGPGGQHANVTASRVEAVIDLSACSAFSAAERERLRERFGERVTATSQQARSQARNRELALERLAERIAAALHVDTERRATRPTRASRERRARQKQIASARKRTRRPPGTDE